MRSRVPHTCGLGPRLLAAVVVSETMCVVAHGLRHYFLPGDYHGVFSIFSLRCLSMGATRPLIGVKPTDQVHAKRHTLHIARRFYSVRFNVVADMSKTSKYVMVSMPLSHNDATTAVPR